LSAIENRVSEIIREYDAQGWHRTGTEVDTASAHWLVGRAGQLGVEATMESLPLSRVEPGESYVEVDGRRVDGIPLFDCSFTAAEGVSGKLGVGGDIGLFDLEPNRGDEAYQQARRSGDLAAIVAFTTGGPPGLGPSNAPNFTDPFGLPVLQVSDEERDWLRSRAEAGASAIMVATATRIPARAFNVVAEIVGHEPELSPVVVMTPRSGWWECAAERGGGIAGWLEIMRSLSEAKAQRTVKFIASTGHELGHIGLESYIDHNLDLPTGAAVWVHLGASIGAAVDWTPHLQTSDASLEEAALRHLKDSRLTVVPTGQVRGGEAEEIHSRGGRYVSIVGGHATFHQQADRWPDAVDVVAMAEYAAAMAGVVLELAAAK
jgi:hypothetical protein